MRCGCSGRGSRIPRAAQPAPCEEVLLRILNDAVKGSACEAQPASMSRDVAAAIIQSTFRLSRASAPWRLHFQRSHVEHAGFDYPAAVPVERIAQAWSTPGDPLGTACQVMGLADSPAHHTRFFLVELAGLTLEKRMARIQHLFADLLIQRHAITVGGVALAVLDVNLAAHGDLDRSLIVSSIKALGASPPPWLLAKLATPLPVYRQAYAVHETPGMPGRLSSLLKRKPAWRTLQALIASASPVCHVAEMVIKLLEGWPREQPVPAEVILRINTLLHLATTRYAHDYVRFSHVANAIFHALSALIVLRSDTAHPVVTYEENATVLRHFMDEHLLPLSCKAVDLEKVTLGGIPAHRGQHAAFRALDLAAQLRPGKPSSTMLVGDSSHTFALLLEEQVPCSTVKASIYWLSLDEHGCVAGDSIAVCIVQRMAAHADSSVCDPVTFVIDMTKGPYEIDRLSPTMLDLVRAGKAAFIFFKHGNVGSAFGDQEQGGGLYAILPHAHQSIWDGFVEGSRRDYSQLPDEQIAAYLEVHAGAVLEAIKADACRAAETARVFMSQCMPACTPVSESGPTVTLKGPFMVLDAMCSVVTGMEGFGNALLFLAPAGVKMRLSPAPSDTIDTLIACAAMYSAALLTMPSRNEPFPAFFRDASLVGQPPLEATANAIRLAGYLFAMQHARKEASSEPAYAPPLEALAYLRCSPIADRSIVRALFPLKPPPSATGALKCKSTLLPGGRAC